MARPVVPQGIRRTKDDASGEEAIEILGKSGRWVPYSFFSQRQASLDNIHEKFGKPDTWPACRFQWTTKDQAPQEQEQVTPDPTPAPQEPTQEPTQEQAPEAPAPQPQPEPEAPQPQRSPLEDMVRIIADGVARDLDNALMSSVTDVIDARLKDYVPTAPEVINRPQVTVEVTVRRPEQDPTTHEGLFHQEFPTLLGLLGAGQHVYLPGPPGSGKSHAAKQAADTLGARFVEYSMSPDMPDSALWGGRTADGGFVDTALTAGLRWASQNILEHYLFVLIDEMDASRAALLVGLGTATANRRVTLRNGEALSWGDNVVFIGAANTFGTGPTSEFAGRNKLDAATLDRFAYIPWDTDEGMEQAVIDQYLDGDDAQAWGDAWRTLRANVKAYGLKAFVTMRGARNGARLLSTGMDMTKVMNLVIGNKIPAEQWAKVNPL